MQPNKPIAPPTPITPTPVPPPVRPGFWDKLKNQLPKFSKNITRRHMIIGAVVVVVLLVGGYFAKDPILNKFWPKNSGEQIYSDKHLPPKPKTEPSKLTGIEGDPAINSRPVIGFMIENSPDARPQAGLSQAGVVFEAIAEGGITRFLALFLDNQPDTIGPVRSVRPYYLDFLLPFDAAIAHAGGSAQGLADIGALGVKDLNHNSSAFRRVSHRYAPHNLYSGYPGIADYGNSKGYANSTVSSLVRKKELPVTPPTASKIDFNISGFLYNPHYDYDVASNSYKRSEGGKPHTDEKTGEQLSPKVVVALVVPRSQSGIYSVYQTTGSGAVFVFQDGTMTKGAWSKAGRKDQLIFKDAAGAPLGLNPGQTWVSLVASENLVTSAP